MYPQSQQLVGYIDSQLSYGVAAAYIRHVLLQAGWPLPIVDTSLNQELAHTAHILPMPLDSHAYYSSVAPQYYGMQPAATLAYWQSAAPSKTPVPTQDTQSGITHFFATCSLAIFRLAVMSIATALIVSAPVAFAGGWLISIALTSGSFGINALAPYVLVCTSAWIIIAVLRLAPAPILAVMKPAMPLRQVIAACWNRE
jgi:hypothetical protein